jgi:hypothetical protein
MSPVSPETATYLDGARFVEWLEDRRLINPVETLRGQVGDRWESTVRRWRNRPAQVYVVDQFLCSIGVCLGELPDDLYCEPPKRGRGKRITPQKARRIRQLASEGVSYAEIGRRLHICHKTAAVHAKAGQS